MVEIIVRTRSWGNSIGVTIPKNVVLKEKIAPNEDIKIEIKKQKTPSPNFFGSLSTWKINTQTLKRKLAEESDW